MDGVELLLRSITKKRGGWVEFYSLQELNNALANSNFAPVFKWVIYKHLLIERITFAFFIFYQQYVTFKSFDKSLNPLVCDLR